MEILLVISAVIPPIILMMIIYSKDKVEKEPKKLLFKAAIFGALSIIPAIIYEKLLMSVLSEIIDDTTSLGYTFLLAFIGIALVEETGKLIALRLSTWKNPNLNYTFDGVVYSVFVSLGFALVENIFYVLSRGLGVSLLRAILAIPGHFSFAVYMGYYYGLAKFYEVAGNKEKKKSCLFKGWLFATLLHGFYDFCSLSGRIEMIGILFVFVIGLDVFVIIKVQKASKTDTPIFRMYQRPYYQVPFNQVYMNPYYVRSAANNQQGAANYYNQQTGSYNHQGAVNIYNQQPGGSYNQQTILNSNVQPQFNANNPQFQNRGTQNPYQNAQNNSGYNQQPQNPAVRYSQPEYLKYQYGEYSPYYNQSNQNA